MLSRICRALSIHCLAAMMGLAIKLLLHSAVAGSSGAPLSFWIALTNRTPVLADPARCRQAFGKFEAQNAAQPRQVRGRVSPPFSRVIGAACTSASGTVAIADPASVNPWLVAVCRFAWGTRRGQEISVEIGICD